MQFIMIKWCLLLEQFLISNWIKMHHVHNNVKYKVHAF